MRIAGIDQGTTSTRILAADETGCVDVVRAIEHRQIYPQDGWVEHEPEELLANIRTCIDAAGPIDAIGIGNQGESCLAWDAETKAALSPVIVWQDNRTVGVLDRLRRDGAERETLALAGLPLDPYFSAAKLAWILDNLPAAQAARRKGTLRLGTTDAFFLDRLTGRCVTDVTTASRTSLMNLETCRWDPDLCALFGVPLDCLPDIVPTTGNFGRIETPSGPVPVTASVVDQQAALFGFGCREAGDAKITFGTGAFALMVTGAEIIRRPELGLLPTVAWQLDGEAPVYALDGGVFTASAAVNWAKSLGLFRDFSEINRFQGPSAIETGLVFVPALAGLGCPHWDPHARGSWSGLGLDHGPLDLVRSVLEGVAFRAAEVVSAMDRCVEIRGEIRVDGGLTKNPYFVEFLGAALSRTIGVSENPELTGLGVIELAGRQAGADLPFERRFRSCEPARDTRAFREVFRASVDRAQAAAQSSAI